MIWEKILFSCDFGTCNGSTKTLRTHIFHPEATHSVHIAHAVDRAEHQTVLGGAGLTEQYWLEVRERRGVKDFLSSYNVFCAPLITLHKPTPHNWSSCCVDLALEGATITQTVSVWPDFFQHYSGISCDGSQLDLIDSTWSDSKYEAYHAFT